MKIGIFDSGLGGLVITKAIHELMPAYDYVYLGDSKRLPYGNKSKTSVQRFTKEGIEYLFKNENCALVIIACNTASAQALRKIQTEFMPKNFPDRKVLGVLIPAAEMATKYKKVGILATSGTVASHSFPHEVEKRNKDTLVFQNAAPELVPLIEAGENEQAVPLLKEYLTPLLARKIDALVLGCTHYPILKNEIKKIVGKKVKIISQDEIIPKKLKNYLIRHPEIDKKLSKKKSIKIILTKLSPQTKSLAKQWFGPKINLKLVEL
jgi:glutamate racemase